MQYRGLDWHLRVLTNVTEMLFCIVYVHGAVLNDQSDRTFPTNSHVCSIQAPVFLFYAHTYTSRSI